MGLDGMTEEFDYIIVGAGSAGCVIANRLSARPDVRVLLLEAGGPDNNIWIHLPVGYFKTMHNPATDWCFETEPCPGLADRRLQWPRGKVLGGSSSINGMLYIRGHASDFDTWRQLGNAGWSFADVLPYFKRAEDQERGADDLHGTGGPLSVSDVRMRRELSDIVIESAVNAGFSRNDDFNGPRMEGVGYFQNTTRNGLRCSTAVGYLRPAQRRRNLSVVTDAHTSKVLVENRRAVGVEYVWHGLRRTARARGEVILAAGAIGSPQILMTSGLGPAAELQKHGIEVVRDIPGVGRNLQDHLQLRMVYRLNTRMSLNDEVRNPLRKVGMAMQYLATRRGPITMAASQVCAFCSSRPGLEAPDLQFHIQPLSADKPGDGLHRFSAFTISPCQLRPESRGMITLRSADPFDPPLIQPNYLATETDRQMAIAGMRIGRSIAAAQPVAALIEREHQPGADVQSDEALLEAARQTGTTIYHPVGTAKMGSDPLAVVDERLRVHGIQALRVVDASIMPSITSGNTNAPTIMIAEKGADMILADLPAQAA